ncbi:MAG: hypothetical protein IJH36_05815, partial [Clostridia bacterium]|nr:hypothetical protein [Clostridia bacterium]
MNIKIDISKIKKASAVEGVELRDLEKELIGAFPAKESEKTRGYERRLKAAYDKYVSYAEMAAEQGDNKGVDKNIYMAWKAIDRLEDKLCSPFRYTERSFRDKVNELYRSLGFLAFVCNYEGRQNVDFRSYDSARSNAKKLKIISCTENEFRIENQLPKAPRGLYPDLKEHWRDVIPKKGYKTNQKKEARYDNIVCENDPQSGGEATYSVKARGRRTRYHLIAAENRLARNDSLGTYGLYRALELCRLPKDRQISDTLRHNLAILSFSNWIDKRSTIDNENALDYLENGFAAFKSIDADFYKSKEDLEIRDLIDACFCNAFGDLLMRFGDTESAFGYYQKVCDTAERSDNSDTRKQAALAYLGIAEICLLADDIKAAGQCCEKALDIFEELATETVVYGFWIPAVIYKTGYIENDKVKLQQAMFAFLQNISYSPCAEFVLSVYENLFDEPPVIPEPEPEPEPELELNENQETKADEETNHPEFTNENEYYESLSGEEKRLYEITLCAPQKYQGKLYYMTERQIREKIDEAYKRHYELNIKYDAENDDDFNYHGDADSSAKYGDAIELLVDHYAMVNDIPNAVKEAKRLLDVRESNLNCQGVYSRCYDYDVMVLAGYKVAWLTKDRRKFKEIIWKGRNCKMAERLKIMYSRCQFTDPPDDNEEPEWDEFRELTSKNGVDLTEGKTQRQIHDEFTLGTEEFAEDL